ncbi:hypothetical protein WK51_26440 [Burkholderia ubonensis]|nr:hypothetical protein WK51_26440 [Burkholderia ubonensis]
MTTSASTVRLDADAWTLTVTCRTSGLGSAVTDWRHTNRYGPCGHANVLAPTGGQLAAMRIAPSALSALHSASSRMRAVSVSDASAPIARITAPSATATIASAISTSISVKPVCGPRAADAPPRTGRSS